ncbi:MAG: DUF1365 domain-containing protein, partial [Cyanobacteria bacterium]|nr:DUF1365 domain-containing protein [Cyanobacteriota bacterium]
MPVRSCLYECAIWHERRLPRIHTFTAKHFMMYLDLQELSSQKIKSRLLSVNRFNLFSFMERDYLPNDRSGRQSLEDRVRSTIRRLGGKREINRIELLT